MYGAWFGAVLSMAVLAVWGKDTSGQEDQALGFGGEFCPGPGGLTGRLGSDSNWA